MATAAGRPLKVGLQLPHWEGGVDGVTLRWADLLALAQQAEAIGFDSIWVVDHSWTIENEFYEGIGRPVPPEVADVPAGLWEIWTLLTALAVATSRIQLGTLVACTGFRNPALLGRSQPPFLPAQTQHVVEAWSERGAERATGGPS